MRNSFLVALMLSANAIVTFAHAQPSTSSNVCLDGYRIDHTKAVDDQTIIFHMKNGTSYSNTLKNHCPGLRMFGFSYVTTPPDKICGNLQSIRVLHTGSVCLLGPFVPITSTSTPTPAPGD